MPGKDGQADVVLLQSPSGVTAHDAKTGNELPWKLDKGCAGIPSSSVVDGVAYIPSEGITAIKADTASTQAEILWQEGRLQPGSASPVVHNGKVYALNRAGVLNCANAADGNLEWQLRLKGSFWASPVASGNHMFLVNADGIVQVVNWAKRGSRAPKANLGEKIQGDARHCRRCHFPAQRWPLVEDRRRSNGVRGASGAFGLARGVEFIQLPITMYARASRRARMHPFRHSAFRIS